LEGVERQKYPGIRDASKTGDRLVINTICDGQLFSSCWGSSAQLSLFQPLRSIFCTTWIWTKIGHWNEAFSDLCTESVLFTLIVGGGVALLASLGQNLFHLKGYSPRAKVGVYLGIGVPVLQYPWDFVGRAAFPKLAESSLTL
jgi:hypothetical protein